MSLTNQAKSHKGFILLTEGQSNSSQDKLRSFCEEINLEIKGVLQNVRKCLKKAEDDELDVLVIWSAETLRQADLGETRRILQRMDSQEIEIKCYQGNDPKILDPFHPSNSRR